MLWECNAKSVEYSFNHILVDIRSVERENFGIELKTKNSKSIALKMFQNLSCTHSLIW